MSLPRGRACDKRARVMVAVPQRRQRQHLSREDTCLYTLLAGLLLELVQPMNDVAQEELVLEVQLIIEISSESIFLRLPVLRHDDDWRLETDDHSQDKVQEHVRVRIESVVLEQPGVQRYPEKEKSNRNPDEFPTASKFRDDISRAVRQCEPSRCF